MKSIKYMKWMTMALLTLSARLHAQSFPAEWTNAREPFRIAGNLYYVGSQDLASYLVVTPKGNILINSNLESSVPQIKASIEKLGFKFKDTKVLLISHAHFDHDAGSAEIIKQTGAKYQVMDGDVGVVQSGGKTDFAYFASPYAPAQVDRILHDGDEVKLADTVLVAHKTAGHTAGCTTWTLKVKDKGKVLNVVIVGSWNVNPGFRLVGKPGGQPASYPSIETDYVHTFEVLNSLTCDVFLGAHAQYFGLDAKLERLKAHPDENVWIDPMGYRKAVAEKEKDFKDELAKQRAAVG
jgi:metallo-beta-lactamase class B